MKFVRNKRTPKVKIGELELAHFPKIERVDPYWNDLYDPKCQLGSDKPNKFT